MPYGNQKPGIQVNVRWLVVCLILSVLMGVALGSGAKSALAADFSGFKVPVSCSDMSGAPPWAMGVYHDQTNSIEIRNFLCAAIDQAVQGKVQTIDEVNTAVMAVSTLSHELSHALGTHDQNASLTGETSIEPDCVAWMLFPWVEHKLGIPPKTAAWLQAKARNWGERSCRAYQATPPGP